MPNQLDVAYSLCADITKRRARNFYYAFIILPKLQRKAIYATYAFCRQTDDYTDNDLPIVEKTRLLRQLHTELNQSYEGKASSPIFAALQDTAQRFNIPKEYFEEIITGVEMDLTITRYQTFQDLYQYCYKVASVVGLICLEIFGYTDPKAKMYAIDMGIAMQLTNIIRDVKEDSTLGRIYIPQDEMEKYGCSTEDLISQKDTPAFRALMANQVTRAKSYFAQSTGLLPLVPFRSRMCPSVLRSLYMALLDRIEARDYDVLRERVGLTGQEKLTLMTTSWLGAFWKSLVRKW